MIYNPSRKELVCLIICGFMALFCLVGCGRHDYKAEADEAAYNIINEKWQDDFGGKANYKISDTTPSPSDIKIEKTIPASGILTLPQAAAMATAHNRQYQTEKELLYIKALDLRLARHDFEPQFFGGGKGRYVKDGRDEGIGAQSNFAFEQLLASGVRVNTNVTAAWVDILTGNMRSGLSTLISTTITKPLLRGSNSKIVMENLTQAERDTVYQIRLFNRFRQTFVVSVISQYYYVLQQFNFLKNAESNHKILTALYGRTEKLADAGRLPRYELDQVGQDKLGAQDIYIQAQKDYKQALDEFKVTLGLPPTAEFTLDENELAALSIVNKPDLAKISGHGKEQKDGELSKEVSDMLEDELDVIKTVLALRLDLANKANAIFDAERKVLVAEDRLRMKLDLTASVDNSSGKRADFSTLGKTKNIAGLGLDLDLPLEQMAEANEYRKALITVTQQKRDYEEAADIVILQVRQAYRDLTKAAERHRVQLESLGLAQKRFKNTLLLMQYGRVNSRRVLDAQNDLFDAKNAATEALVGHTVAMLNFYRDVGVLQVRPDGMWEY
jgi:outer membrane protein TolC